VLPLRQRQEHQEIAIGGGFVRTGGIDAEEGLRDAALGRLRVLELRGISILQDLGDVLPVERDAQARDRVGLRLGEGRQLRLAVVAGRGDEIGRW